MREKIAELILGIMARGIDVDLTREHGFTEAYQAKTNEILSLITAEIEKVENELIFIKTVPSMGDDLLKWHYDKGFKDCRQAILKILT